MTTTQRTASDLPADIRPSVRNILRVYRRATDRQMREGIEWYADAHSAALALDPGNPARAAGIIAALSPKQSWARNLTLAARVYADGEASGAMHDQVAKANRIYAGETPLDVLGGSKVRAFYAAILDPTDPHAIVVDRHAFDIAVGHRNSDEGRNDYLSRPWIYEAFADTYRRAARRLGVTPSQVQAVTWVVWRETEAAYHKANSSRAEA